MKRRFDDYTKAEHFAEEMVFGGDDATIVAELVEVWPNEDAYEEAMATEGYGTMYVVWGTEEAVDAEVTALGEFIDRKGMTGRIDPRA